MIDYQATLNAMNAAKEAGARHFILLSAFCVAKPWLQFQFAKLDFEEKLTAQTDLTYAGHCARPPSHATNPNSPPNPSPPRHPPRSPLGG